MPNPVPATAPGLPKTLPAPQGGAFIPPADLGHIATLAAALRKLMVEVAS